MVHLVICLIGTPCPLVVVFEHSTPRIPPTHLVTAFRHSVDPCAYAIISHTTIDAHIIAVHIVRPFHSCPSFEANFNVPSSIAVGHYWLPNCPLCYDRYEWEGFGVIFSLNFLGLLIIAIRRDIVWCAGAVWVCASVWRETPKSGPVQVRRHLS